MSIDIAKSFSHLQSELFVIFFSMQLLALTVVKLSGITSIICEEHSLPLGVLQISVFSFEMLHVFLSEFHEKKEQFFLH